MKKERKEMRMRRMRMSKEKMKMKMGRKMREDKGGWRRRMRRELG